MADIKPFRAIRPRNDLADKIGSLPYDVMNSEEAKEMVKDNKLSFMRIDRAEINFSETVDPHDRKVYDKAREVLDGMIERGEFIQDANDSLYIYRQIMDGRAQTGLVCGASIDDYANDVIKKHEFTRLDKEQDRIDHIKALNAQTGPIFLTYMDTPEVRQIINNWTDVHKPVYQFTADGVEQIIWIVNCSDTISKLVNLFESMDHLYIADGHHRSSAAVQVGMEMRKEQQEGNFNHFLSVLFPSTDLKIWPYNRVVQDLNGYTSEEFLEKIQQQFVLEDAPLSPYEPESKYTFGMYLDNKWYKLTAKPEIIDADDPVKSLDVAILQDYLLNPLLNIKDPRTDERIDFIGGIRGVKELERRVSTDMKVAFSMYPTSIDEVINIADINQVMPPKSTWFEPKLLSGLFINKLT